MLLRRWLIVIWLCFIVRGLLYCSVWPMWEGVDEWAHFGVMQEMSMTGHPVINRNTPVSKEVSSSFQLAALPRGMANVLPPAVTREEYWNLPIEERARRETALQALTTKSATDPSNVRLPAYEASQPPLYYWLMAIVLRVLGNATLVDQVWSVRIAGFAIGSLSIPIGFILSRKIFGNESIALALTSLVVLMPGLAINLARVSNEPLGVAVGALLLLAVCRWIEQPQSQSRSFGVGVTLGLGLLTKAYFLTAAPALLLLHFGIIWRNRNAGGGEESPSVCVKCRDCLRGSFGNGGMVVPAKLYSDRHSLGPR